MKALKELRIGFISALTLLQILTPTVIGAAVFLSSYFIQMPEAIQLAAAILAVLAITGGTTLFLIMVGILTYVYGETLPDA